MLRAMPANDPSTTVKTEREGRRTTAAPMVCPRLGGIDLDLHLGSVSHGDPPRLRDDMLAFLGTAGRRGRVVEPEAAEFLQGVLGRPHGIDQRVYPGLELGKVGIQFAIVSIFGLWLEVLVDGDVVWFLLCDDHDCRVLILCLVCMKRGLSYDLHQTAF